MNDRIILVVDDETDLLEMVKSIFTRAGFTQVLTASSGEAALKMCEEQEPDMMILDVNIRLFLKSCRNDTILLR